MPATKIKEPAPRSEAEAVLRRQMVDRSRILGLVDELVLRAAGEDRDLRPDEEDLLRGAGFDSDGIRREITRGHRVFDARARSGSRADFDRATKRAEAARAKLEKDGPELVAQVAALQDRLAQLKREAAESAADVERREAAREALRAAVPPHVRGRFESELRRRTRELQAELSELALALQHTDAAAKLNPRAPGDFPPCSSLLRAYGRPEGVRRVPRGPRQFSEVIDDGAWDSLCRELEKRRLRRASRRDELRRELESVRETLTRELLDIYV